MGLIVFDTCTKPVYYQDVHRLLAMPTGTLLPYDYERKLFSDTAFAQLTEARATDMPIKAYLFYAQLKSFVKGNVDPEFNLNLDTSIFIPTRYAKIRNVCVDNKIGGDGTSRPNVFFHLELMGFPDPDLEIIPRIMNILCARGEIPFSKWIAAAPTEVDLSPLEEEGDSLWGKVIDRIALKPSQFNGDVFWRVASIEKTTGTTTQKLYPEPRLSNRFGDREFFADYQLSELSEYRITITNIIPQAENREFPPETKVTAVEDVTSLLLLPEKARPIRRNAGTQFSFGAKMLDVLTPRHAKILLETLVPDQEGPYPPDQAPS
jgi:hypothetical protein